MSDRPFALPILARVALNVVVADPRVRALVDALEAYAVTLHEYDWHKKHLLALVERQYSVQVVQATESRLAVLQDEERRGFEALERAGAAFDAPAAQGDLLAFARRACALVSVEGTSQDALNEALARLYEALDSEALRLGRLPPPPTGDRKGP